MRIDFGKMKNKTNNLGRLFFEQKWNDTKIKIHSECVIEACLSISSNTHLNPDVFIIAGWIHDIGQKTDKDQHHVVSLNFLEEFLEQNPPFASLETELTDCIINHRSNGTPKTIYGLIFKCADKVALHNKRWLEYKKKEDPTSKGE